MRSSLAPLRPDRITLAPARAHSSASARPKPPLAPVIMITRPSSKSALGVKLFGYRHECSAMRLPRQRRAPCRGPRQDRDPAAEKQHGSGAAVRLFKCFTPSAASTARWRSGARSASRQRLGRGGKQFRGAPAHSIQIGLQAQGRFSGGEIRILDFCRQAARRPGRPPGRPARLAPIIGDRARRGTRPRRAPRRCARVRACVACAPRPASRAAIMSGPPRTTRRHGS